MLDIKTYVSGLARHCGIHLQRWHDPYKDAQQLLPRPIRHAIDGGAHRGTVTRRLREAFPQAVIHAFEPQSDSFAVLQQTFAGDPRVRPWRAALGRDNSTANLNINKACYSSLLNSLDPAAMQATGTTESVPVLRLDDWAASERIEPEFLKLDLQGYELQALEGAENLLLHHIRAVLTEVNFVRRYAQSPLFHEVTGFLDKHGFHLYRLYEVWGSPSGGYQQGDALFVHRSLLSNEQKRAFAVS